MGGVGRSGLDGGCTVQSVGRRGWASFVAEGMLLLVVLVVCPGWTSIFCLRLRGCVVGRAKVR
jgi:hypothetical protein